MEDSPVFSLPELYLAYRKAKYEAFRDNSHFSAIPFCNFESELDKNLQTLLSELNRPDGRWARRPNFLGGYLYAPKDIAGFSIDAGLGPQIRAADPAEEWINQFKRGGRQRCKAEFRLVMSPSVNLHIISALWIARVGHMMDAALDDAHVYANRVRRIYSAEGAEEMAAGRQPNRDSLGIFPPYFSAYAKWRKAGMDVMRRALAAGDRILAVTMDIRRFYHNVSPSFLLKQRFHAALGITLSDSQLSFTKLLIEAIDTWYRQTPDFEERPEGAIPVGLSASRVISNVLLHEFDSKLSTELRPLYYGRYVDDLFLVIRPPVDVSDGTQFLKLLAARLGTLGKFSASKGEPSLKLDLPYAKDSTLEFVGAKQKLFNLSGPHGLDLVEHIGEQIRTQSSAHRLLPELPDSDTSMASRALLATTDASLEADALRKADVVSVRRLGFALLLRDVEAYARDLAPSAWKGLRRRFYRLVKRHLLTPHGFFDYHIYLNRAFGLMVACQDFSEIKSLLVEFRAVVDLLRSTTTAGTAERQKFVRCLSYYGHSFVQAAVQASTVDNYGAWPELLRTMREIERATSIEAHIETGNSLRKLSFLMLICDWGRRPYKEFWIHAQKNRLDGPKVPLDRDVQRELRVGVIRPFRKLAELKIPYWPALSFPTRPLSLAEITMVAPKTLDEPRRLRRIILSLRGARVPGVELLGKRPHGNGAANTPTHYWIPNFPKRKPRVVITSLETSERQWKAAAKGRPDLSLRRYVRLRRLLNRVLRDHRGATYVVLPELSVPKKWSMELASHLAKAGISLLAGLEYSFDRKKHALRNDCLVSLCTTWPGYTANILRLQPKLAPAHHEKAELARMGAPQLLEAENQQGGLPIYVHGGMFFGILLCSDLTNISNRRFFQGAVDSLFILEWNPDVKTFSFLLEATSHDIHAFAIQVNNRMYGDSRVRAPFRDEHLRDLVRLKGGERDYHVLSSIDFLPLRAYHRSGGTLRASPFKPLPIGFVCSPQRESARTLPNVTLFSSDKRRRKSRGSGRG